MSLQINKFLILIVLAIAGCGFQPVYGDKSHALGSRIYSVAVGDIQADEADSAREAQLLRGHLEDDLRHGNKLDNAKYRLDVKFNKIKEPQAVRLNRDITRYKLTVEARYKLIEISTGREVTSGTSRGTDSFDAPSAFATYTVYEDTVRRILKENSREIVQRISISLSKEKDKIN